MDFPFTFPLLHTDGFQIAEIEGVADIAINSDGDWYVAGVEIEGRKRNGKTLTCRMIPCETGGMNQNKALHIEIWRHIESDCAVEIETAIYERGLAAERADTLGYCHMQRELV